jgi:GGDEF domain-containing protein
MSLQGPLIVVADAPATELTSALSAAGAFPIVESTWADAPTAFVAVKPAAIVIAEAGEPPSESAARMLCLQIATFNGPIVPIVAVSGSGIPALPIALPALPQPERVIARLQSALRVRALHATVLRRLDSFSGPTLPKLPSGDALEDATVLVAGRGPLYPALSTAMGERVKMVGALSIEAAAKHLEAREIDGVVVGDGFSPRMLDSFLQLIAQETHLRDLPVVLVGASAAGLDLPNVDEMEADPATVAARMVPLVRVRAFEAQLRRMLSSLDTGGMLDPATGLLTRDHFFRDLKKAVAEASDRSQPLSLARFAFDGPLDARASLDAARLVTRLVRAIDFATRDDDGAVLIAFTQTSLRSAHVVARRIAGLLKTTMLMPHRAKVTANVTLATLKAGDTPDTLMLRILGSRMVAAE